MDYQRRREGLPIIPTLIQGGVGAAQGLIAAHDVNAWANDPKNTTKVPGQAPPLSFANSKTLWLDLAAIGAGAVGLFMDVHEDLAESLIGAGAFGLSSTLAFHFAQSGHTKPTNPQAAVAARAAARVGAPAGAVASGYLKQSTGGLL